MNRVWRSSLFAAVEVLVVTAMVPGVAWAQANKKGPDVQVQVTNKPDCPVGETPTVVGYDEVNGLRIPRYDCKVDCTGQVKSLQDKEEAMNKACREAGLPADCVERVVTCIPEEEVSASGDSNWLQQLFPIAGQITGNPALSNLAQNPTKPASIEKCSNLSDKDYFDKKDRLDRDLQQAKKDAADLERDIAAEQEKLNEKIKDAQDKISDAQKDLSEFKGKVDRDKREANKSFMESQANQAREMQSLAKREADIRMEVAKFEREYTTKLINMREELSQAKCLGQVTELRNALDKNRIYGAKEMRARKDTLQAAWDACIATSKKERTDLMKTRQDYLTLQNQALAEIENARGAGDESIRMLQKELDENLKGLEQSYTDAQQRLLQQMQSAQTALQSSNLSTQQRAAALRVKQTALNARISTLTSDIAKLGPQPQAGAKGGWRDAQGAVVTYLTQYDAFCKNKCGDDAKYKNSMCGTVARSKQKQLEKIRKADSNSPAGQK